MQRDGGMFASCIYGVQSGYERVRKAVSTNGKKTLAEVNYNDILSPFCALFQQMQAFKNGNARLLLGFLSVMRFDIPVIVTMNDKYSMRLLRGCRQEGVICLSFRPITDKLRLDLRYNLKLSFSISRCHFLRRGYYCIPLLF